MILWLGLRKFAAPKFFGDNAPCRVMYARRQPALGEREPHRVSRRRAFYPQRPMKTSRDKCRDCTELVVVTCVADFNGG